jgi:hypothetical protein
MVSWLLRSSHGVGWTSVADPDTFDTDPDSAFHFDTDPDPAFPFYPDPTV